MRTFESSQPEQQSLIWRVPVWLWSHQWHDPGSSGSNVPRSSVKHLWKILSSQDLNRVVNALVSSCLEYWNALHRVRSQNSSHCLQLVQNVAGKRITSYLPIKFRFLDFRLLTLKLFVVLHQATLLGSFGHMSTDRTLLVVSTSGLVPWGWLGLCFNAPERRKNVPEDLVWSLDERALSLWFHQTLLRSASAAV